MSNHILLFISHSSEDAELATGLIELVRGALNLSATAIRCSSVDGYRLPGGAKIDERLRQEVHDSEAFIGIISASGIRSTYVLFELGARWGIGKHLLPLLAHDTPATILKGPLAGLNVLRSDSRAQLLQLVSEIGEVLAVQPERPEVYAKCVERILRIGSVAPSGSIGGSPGRDVQPKIVFTQVPPAGAGGPSRGDIAGRIEELEEPDRYQLVLYAHTDVWYVQPLESDPYTEIGSDGEWGNWTHLGHRYAALIVRSSFHPPTQIPSLPAVTGDVIAKAEVPAS